MLNELALAVRNGEVDPVQLVEESLGRIAAASPELNAVTAVREEALEEAASHGRQGVLAGLPVLVKDLDRCKGMRTTFGSELFADAPPDDIDDVVVERLRGAGAIVVGRSNTPAFGVSAVTVNRLYGATRNPWNPLRSPGGSSGGAGAALAASLVPLATSSDGGGSVRIPASCCGLVGYKPTMGTIGRNILPGWVGFSMQGSTGRTVADVVLEASVIHGPARGDFLALPRGSVDIQPRSPRRVLACRSFRSEVDATIEAAYDEALRDLERAGVSVERIDLAPDDSVVALWLTIAWAEFAHSLADVRDRWESFEPSINSQLFAGELVTLADYLSATRQRHAVTAKFDDLLGDDAVLITPTCNVQSWAPEGPLPVELHGVENAAIGVNTIELNVTGHPGVSVPLGTDDVGVPFGLQIMAPRFRDGLALGLATTLERIRPWPLVANGYTLFGSESLPPAATS